MIQLASHIIDTKEGHFDPKKFEDHYETALVELLRKKQEGRAIEPVREEGPALVILLCRSRDLGTPYAVPGPNSAGSAR